MADQTAEPDHEAALSVALNWSPEEQLKYGRSMDYGLSNLCRAYPALRAEQQATQGLAEDWAAKAGDYLARNAASRERAEASEARCAALVKALEKSMALFAAIRSAEGSDADSFANTVFGLADEGLAALKEETEPSYNRPADHDIDSDNPPSKEPT